MIKSTLFVLTALATLILTACSSEYDHNSQVNEYNTRYNENVATPISPVIPAPHLTVNSHGDIVKHFLGVVVNTGTNNGFSDSNVISENDSHFGWTLGRFFVSGYTRVTGVMDEPIFIRTLGDEITLNFNLEQDIDALNRNDNLVIMKKTNAFDEHFGIERTNFGRGTLIIRHTDWRNFTGDPIVYTNYLSAVVANADTLVMFLEEGDYEVALNYAIHDPRLFRGIGSAENYRIFFRFSVRNGESMVFSRDVITGAELTNGAVTPHGFYLDLARSRFLDVDIRREVLVQGAEGLTEDIRFNRPARDGTQYTDEGIYTITARNRYTNQETIKRIYVGTNSILIAHMNTGYPISMINQMMASGATITNDGEIIQAVSSEQTEDFIYKEAPAYELEPQVLSYSSNQIGIDTTLVAAIVIVCLVGYVILKNRRTERQGNKGEKE